MAAYESGTETKNKILDAAIGLFMEKGFNNTTYADICTVTGVNQGSIYYHFRKKAELYYQAHQRVNHINSYVARQLCGEDSPAYFPFLLDIYIYWFRYFTESGFRRLMSENATPDSPDDTTLNMRSFWERCRAFIGDYDAFLEAHALDFLICSNIDYTMAMYYRERTQSSSFMEAAEYELRSFAAIFHMHRDVCEQTLSQIREILKEETVRQLPSLLESAGKEA